MALEINFVGPEVESPGSSGMMSHWAGAFPSQGRGSGNAIVAQWIHDYAGPTTGWRFLGHNAHGSLIVVTDLNGYRTSMYVSTDYGAALHHKVVFDGQDSRISSLAHSTPSLGFTTITLSGTPLTTDELNGLELVISRPGSTGDRYITARVSDTTSSTIVVADVGGASAPVYAALNGQTQGFVVYDFHTGDNTTGGNWTDDPDYVPFLTVTGFTDETADFHSYMVGWTLIADVEKPSFLTIFAVPTATRVEVFGDATGLSADGKTYRLVAPPGVDPKRGALSKPSTVLSKSADNRGCMWLWSGYQYVPPQVGHNSGGSTTGAQGGINKLGTYYCWNRTYDVFMGRWTTPDPAATPWGNLWDYVGQRPLQAADPKGTSWIGFLKQMWQITKAMKDGVKTGKGAQDAFKKFVDQAQKGTRENCKLQMEGYIQSFCMEMCDDVKGDKTRGNCIKGCEIAMTAKKDELVKKLCDDPDRGREFDWDILTKDYLEMDDKQVKDHVSSIKKKYDTPEKRKTHLHDAWDLCYSACSEQYEKCIKDAPLIWGRKAHLDACDTKHTECNERCAHYKNARDVAIKECKTE